MELKCSIQNYDWGQLGDKSLVAKLAEKNDLQLIIDGNKPYAELWMGTHPNGPSFIKDLDITLKQYIDEYPKCLGQNSQELFGQDLSFLFKVLSIRKALSLQVHPNKTDAEKLHLNYPTLYPDDNHKPELAVALTNFRALCGFRPLSEIVNFFKIIPGLCELIDEEHCHNFINRPSIDLLRKCFESYLTSTPLEAKKSCKKFMEKFCEPDFTLRDSQLVNLFVELNKIFPDDIGLFSIFFLNYLTLEPGEAIFLKAGLPHAYLYGDCVEVMARSDNVVRAGLTPKVRDVATLVNILVYEPMSVNSIKFSKEILSNYVCRYRPPIKDFALNRYSVPENEEYTLPILNCASILIVIHGKAEGVNLQLKPGKVLFVPSDTMIKFSVKKHIEIYQAYTNLNYLPH